MFVPVFHNQNNKTTKYQCLPVLCSLKKVKLIFYFKKITKPFKEFNIIYRYIYIYIEEG